MAPYRRNVVGSLEKRAVAPSPIRVGLMPLLMLTSPQPLPLPLPLVDLSLAVANS